VAGMVKWASAHQCPMATCFAASATLAWLRSKPAEVGTVGDIAMTNVPIVMNASGFHCKLRVALGTWGGIGAARLAQEAISNVVSSEFTGT
jgi:hypothetical protein